MPILKDPRSGKSIGVFGEIEAEWLREVTSLRGTECQHPDKELRVRKVKGERVMVMHQCTTCGEGTGGAVSQNEVSLSSPLWDESLASRYMDQRERQRSEIDQKCCDLAMRQDAETEAALAKADFVYQEYLRSAVWQKKRALVFRRAGGVCEGCLTAPAAIVHHKTYRKIGDELAFDLVALCNPCHDKAHPEHRESFYDHDYSPCTDCRHAVSDSQCGRLQQPRYLALSADGECGPRWNGFEGLK